MQENYYRGVSEALQYAIRFLEGHDKDIAVDEFQATLDQLRHGFYVDFRVDWHLAKILENDEMFVYGYRLGLQHMASIYLRLLERGELDGCCEDCPLVEELEHLLELSCELEVEQLEAELGYYLD